jgi:hypothetical protein
MSLTISLSPNGLLQVHLPGANATIRKLELSTGHETESLFRMLHAQAREGAAVRFESDAEPSASLLYHQEHHQASPVETCAHCLAWAKHLKRRSRRHLPASHEAGRGIKVTLIPAKSNKISQRKIELSLEDLGL